MSFDIELHNIGCLPILMEMYYAMKKIHNCKFKDGYIANIGSPTQQNQSIAKESL